MHLDVCAGNADAESIGGMLEPQAALTTVSDMPRGSTDVSMSKHKRTFSMYVQLQCASTADRG